MNALEYLSQAYLLEQRIETRAQQISSLRSLARSMNAFSENDPVKHDRNVTCLEDTVIKIMEWEHELNLEIDRLVDLKREIHDVISQVKDVNLRLVLEKRHLCFESWPRIAEEMGRSVRWAQIKHRMGLIAVEAVLERKER